MAEERRMCIWNALHQNPRINSDGEDSKMRGWIGTELGNKVSDTLISIKTKTANGVSFTVKQQDARGKDIDDWKFEVTDDAGNLGVPRITSNGANLPSKSKEQPICDDPKLIREWIEQAKDHYEWPMSRVQIKSTVFGDIGGVKNKDKQQADLMFMHRARRSHERFTSLADILVLPMLLLRGLLFLRPSKSRRTVTARKSLISASWAYRLIRPMVPESRSLQMFRSLQILMHTVSIRQSSAASSTAFPCRRKRLALFSMR
jgi:hypothetical protein